MNIRRLSEISDDFFSQMAPIEQKRYIIDHSGETETLKRIYPRAKDDMLRLMIIDFTHDPDLALRLFNNLPFHAGVLKTKLLKYLPATAQNEIKEFLMALMNDFDASLKVIDKLNPFESRALLQSLTNLNIIPEGVMGYLKNKVEQNPIMDPDELE